jgi:hypothetical protein
MLRCTSCCNFYDNSKQQQGSSTKNLFLTGSKNYKFSTISDHKSQKQQRSRLSSYFLLYKATFSCFHFTPDLAFGEKDISHPAITEYLFLTGQGKLRNRKIISERKQTFYGNSLLILLYNSKCQAIFNRLNQGSTSSVESVYVLTSCQEVNG